MIPEQTKFIQTIGAAFLNVIRKMIRIWERLRSSRPEQRTTNPATGCWNHWNKSWIVLLNTSWTQKIVDWEFRGRNQFRKISGSEKVELQKCYCSVFFFQNFPSHKFALQRRKAGISEFIVLHEIEICMLLYNRMFLKNQVSCYGQDQGPKINLYWNFFSYPLSPGDLMNRQEFKVSMVNVL